MTKAKSKAPSPTGEHAVEVSQLRILDEDGALLGEPPKIEEERLGEMLRLMMLGRRFDQKAIALQRRGKLGTYPPMSGQEAASVGSAFAMDPTVDHFVPSYREQLIMVHWGLPFSRYLLQRMGHPAGSVVPSHGRLWPQQVALAAHLPHAVGLAWGLKLQDREGVVMAHFGDGASNEGDFHEALNIAGVRKAPVVFICQNNGWAISIPWERQSAAASVASRAAGYGFPGVAVDGNDVLAVYTATAEARARAASGGGPTLIEARTTRLGAHSTADDPTRYVPPEWLEGATRRDPIARFRTWLAAQNMWDDEREKAAEAWCDDFMEQAIREYDETPKPDPEGLFDHLLAERGTRLQRQRDDFVASRETDG
jgi:pyruvate dehydrogenase E1 component alpha subunit